MNGGGREDEREEKAAGKGKISLSLSLSPSVCLDWDKKTCVIASRTLFYPALGD